MRRILLIFQPPGHPLPAPDLGIVEAGLEVLRFSNEEELFAAEPWENRDLLIEQVLIFYLRPKNERVQTGHPTPAQQSVFRLIHFFRNRTLLRPIPIVFVAPAGDYPLKLACLSAGVAEFLEYPLKRRELLLVIRKHLKVIQEWRHLHREIEQASNIQDMIYRDSREKMRQLEDQVRAAQLDLEKNNIAQEAMFELSRQELLEANRKLQQKYEAEIKAMREKARIEALFGRYVSPEIVERVTDPEKARELDGVRRVITVFFADIRGFTGISENMPPEKVIFLLNEFFTEMTQIIHDQGGWVDKYAGDNIMALFGAPIGRADHAEWGVRAGVAVMRKFAILKNEWREIFGIQAGLGIGLATGDAVIGNIGSFQKISYTAIGDTVNVAARLEANCRDGSIMLNDECYQSLPANLVSELGVAYRGDIPVKGKALPVRTYFLDVYPRSGSDE